MKINDALKARRLQLGLTLDDVGQACGVGKSTVRKWESGIIENMGRDKISKLSRVLRLSPVALLNDDIDIADLSAGNIIPVKKRLVPLLGTIAAGKPIYADEQVETYVSIDDNIPVDFALRVQGDSMVNARINDGDIVFIHQQPTVEDGDIAAVLIDDDATLKRVYRIGEGVQLMPENPKYKPMYFDATNCDTFKILGKAASFYSKL
jgi:repressor LexA